MLAGLVVTLFPVVALYWSVTSEIRYTILGRESYGQVFCLHGMGQGVGCESLGTGCEWPDECEDSVFSKIVQNCLKDPINQELQFPSFVFWDWYHEKSIGPHPTAEVMPCWAALVLGWATNCRTPCSGLSFFFVLFHDYKIIPLNFRISGPFFSFFMIFLTSAQDTIMFLCLFRLRGSI